MHTISKRGTYNPGPMCISINRKKFRVHCLVAYYFLGPKPDEYVVFHKDGNKCNNERWNLEYIQKKDVCKRMLPFSVAKTGSPVCKIDVKTKEVIDFYSSVIEAAKDNYIDPKGIFDVLNGSQITAGGYKWIRDNECLHINHWRKDSVKR